MLEHLHAVHQGCATADRRSDVQRLGHLLEVGALLQGLLRIGVDAIGALDGMRYRQHDQRLLARRQRTRLEDFGVVIEKLVGELLAAFADVAELREVLRLVVSVHGFLALGKGIHGTAACYVLISRAVIVYLKLSGSRLSSLSLPVSACGYMRKPTAGPLEPGSRMSCA